MLLSSFNQGDPEKPPQIFQPVKLLHPIGNDYILKQTFFRPKTGQNCQLMLFESFILMQVDDCLFRAEIDMTIGFEIRDEQMQIKFQFCENDPQIFQVLQFSEEKVKVKWFEELRRRMPQLNFESKYQKLGLKGKGKNCQVYEITRYSDSQKFVVKVGSMNSDFSKEIQILGELDHPNTVYFQQFYVQKGNAFIVLDYEDGGTLFDQLKTPQSLNPKQRVKIYTDILNGLQFLRIKGIVHRDLKPENILFSNKDKNYKLADFGLATKQKNPYQYLVGTPGYIAPELFQINNQITDKKSDIYSAGLIFYEVITKECYFEGDNANDILKNNIQGKGKRSLKHPNISSFEKSLLNMMLSSKPSKRKDSYQLLQSSVFNSLVKEYSLETKNSQKTRKSSNDEEDEAMYGFMDVVKNFLRIRSNSSY